MCWRSLTLSLLLCLSVPSHALDSCEEMIEQGNRQLETMRRHASDIEQSLKQLNEALQAAEKRNELQTQVIERLQDELHAQRIADPEEHERQRTKFFRVLWQRLPPSALYDILPDRVIVANDPVFIFGKGEIGAEGQERLAPLADALRGLVAEMPEAFPWRLRIEGHSDIRPLRSHPLFASNWELSAARAVSMLRFLVAQGLPEDRLSAVGLADTRLRDQGESFTAHQRNRRVEIHLTYGAAFGN